MFLGQPRAGCAGFNEVVESTTYNGSPTPTERQPLMYDDDEVNPLAAAQARHDAAIRQLSDTTALYAARLLEHGRRQGMTDDEVITFAIGELAKVAVDRHPDDAVRHGVLLGAYLGIQLAKGTAGTRLTGYWPT
jgi:hypothetical protein